MSNDPCPASTRELLEAIANEGELIHCIAWDHIQTVTQRAADLIAMQQDRMKELEQRLDSINRLHSAELEHSESMRSQLRKAELRLDSGLDLIATIRETCDEEESAFKADPARVRRIRLLMDAFEERLKSPAVEGRMPEGSFGGELDEYSPGARSEALRDCPHDGDRQRYANGSEWCMKCGRIIADEERDLPINTNLSGISSSGTAEAEHGSE